MRGDGDLEAMLSSRDAALQQRICQTCQAGNMAQSEGLQLSLYDTRARWDLLQEPTAAYGLIIPLPSYFVIVITIHISLTS